MHIRRNQPSLKAEGLAEGNRQTVKAVRPDDEVVLFICLGLAEGKAAKFFYVAKRNKKIFFFGIYID